MDAVIDFTVDNWGFALQKTKIYIWKVSETLWYFYGKLSMLTLLRAAKSTELLNSIHTAIFLTHINLFYVFCDVMEPKIHR